MKAKWTVEVKTYHSNSKWLPMVPAELYTKAGAERDAKQLRESNPQYRFRVVKLAPR
jgi:hypothetical protein